MYTFLILVLATETTEGDNSVSVPLTMHMRRSDRHPQPGIASHMKIRTPNAEKGDYVRGQRGPSAV